METVPKQHACLSNKRILLIVQARKWCLQIARVRWSTRSTLNELDIEDFLIEDRGKLFLPEYLDKTFTPNEKQVIRESSNVMQNPTIKDYPRAASFLLEHDNNIHGPIPDMVSKHHTRRIIGFFRKTHGYTHSQLTPNKPGSDGRPFPQKPWNHYIEQTNHIICNQHN